MKSAAQGTRKAPPNPLGIGDGRVLVYGLGRSGLAAAQLLTRHRIPFGFYDDTEVPGYRQLSDKIRWPEVQVHFQSLPQEVLMGYDLVVVSPGVPAQSPTLLMLKGAGLNVISEIELAFAFTPAPVIAVTGSNGKTTTVTMAELLLNTAGFKAKATGNIGYPFSLAVLDEKPDYFVVECSSFQLHHIERFAPRAAIITSFAPNHLDWHGDEESYFQSKMNVVNNLGAKQPVIIPAGNARIAGALKKSKAKKLTFGTRGDVAFDEKHGTITRKVKGKKVIYAELKPILAHLTYDFRIISEAAMAVSALASALGLKGRVVEQMIAAFTPLHHRIEVVGKKDGVTYINDSKSTSVDATIFALKKQSNPVVLMLGGRDKGLSFHELIPAALGRVKAVVVFGEAREKIAREIGGELPLESAVNLDEAVARARRLANPGEVVLFSPACASYDQFKNYEERGEAFRKIVNSLKA